MEPRRYLWLAVVAAAIAFAWAATVWEPLLAIDEPALDVQQVLSAPGFAEGTPLAIVHADAASAEALGPWPWPADVLDRVLRLLAAERPRAIVLAFPPPPGYANPLAGPRVVWPARLERTPHGARAFRVADPAPAPEAAPHLFPADAVTRVLPLFHPREGGGFDLTLLGQAVSAGAGGLDLEDPARPRRALVGGGRRLPLEPTALGPGLRIHWVGEGLPSFGALSLAHVIDGHLGEALADRIVLLGPADPEIDPGVATPTSARFPMPRLEVLAHALDTALRPGRALWRPPAWAAALASALLLLVHGFICRQARPRTGALITLALVAAWFAIQGALFRAGLVVPFAPLAIAAFGAYAALAALGAAEVDSQLGQLALELSRLDRRIDLGDDDGAEVRFRRALELAALFVEVDSLLLFRARSDTHRLELLAALRASEEDVAERRRDPRRSPWKEALDPTRRVIRPGFLRAERGASTLLAPLSLGNRTLGVLAVSRAHASVDGFERDDALIRFIAQQLATLLYRDELRRPGERSRWATLRGLALRDRFERRLGAVERAARGLLEQKELLFSTLVAMDAGVAVCDLFGRVVLYNERLGAILEKGGVALAGRNLVDLIHDLAGLERADIIRRFTGVVMDEPFELLLAPGGPDGPAYRFSLSAMRGRGGPLVGLAAVFADVTALRELDRMKTNLLDMVSFRVLNMLSSIQGYAELLTDAAGLSAEERGFARAVLDETRGLASVFDAVSAMARVDLTREGLKLRPLDLVLLIREAFAAEEGALGREVGLELAAPARFDIVAADQEQLREALGLVLRAAIDTAERRSALRVSVAEEERYLRVDIANRGFGMPADQARALFGGAGAADEAPLRRVREIFEVHGGTVKADATVGEGVRFHLWLPLFMKG